MSDTTTMVRTQMVVNDAAFFLAQGQDLDDLKRRIEDAAHAGGRFERFVVVGDRAVEVLFLPTTQVALSIETVEFDPRDTGDDGMPFGDLGDG